MSCRRSTNEPLTYFLVVKPRGTVSLGISRHCCAREDWSVDLEASSLSLRQLTSLSQSEPLVFNQMDVVESSVWESWEMGWLFLQFFSILFCFWNLTPNNFKTKNWPPFALPAFDLVLKKKKNYCFNFQIPKDNTKPSFCQRYKTQNPRKILAPFFLLSLDSHRSYAKPRDRW